MYIETNNKQKQRMKINIYLLVLLLFLLSCTEKPYQKLPFYEIKSQSGRVSYLLACNDYLKEIDFNQIVSSKAMIAFDSSEQYIQLFDIPSSNIGSLKPIIGLSSGTLDSRLSPNEINILTASNISLEKIKTSQLKAIFFLLDEYTPKNTSFFNQSNFWLKKAVASKKEMNGLFAIQNYYQKVAELDTSLQLRFIKKHPTDIYKKEILQSYKNSLKPKNDRFSEALLTPLDFSFYTPKEKNAFQKELLSEGIDHLSTSLIQKKSFIVLDLKYFYGSGKIQDVLLSKGYQLTQIH